MIDAQTSKKIYKEPYGDLTNYSNIFWIRTEIGMNGSETVRRHLTCENVGGGEALKCHDMSNIKWRQPDILILIVVDNGVRRKLPNPSFIQPSGKTR